MAGVATRTLVANRVAQQLASDGSPAAALIEANRAWYHFGALGPAIGDFVPSEKPEAFGAPGRTPYWAVWKEVMTIAVGNRDAGLPGIVEVLRTFRSVLGEVGALVADEDLDGLKELAGSGRLDQIKDASAKLGVILTAFSKKEKLEQLGELMGVRSRPAIVNPDNLLPEQLWTGREWLHWKKPGAFAVALRQRAESSGDDALRAYALGWAVAYATLLCTSGFVNAVVGSTYRTHWWRHRFVCNFVDTWAWGFYPAGATMGTDDKNPTPPYETWPALCDAKLHALVDVTGGAGAQAESLAVAIAADHPLPSLLPGSFTDMWLGAFGDAYGGAGPPVFTAARLQRAYAALLAVLWFQTSGEVIGCNRDPGPPPEACGADAKPPDWADPTKKNPVDDKPFQPVTPTPEPDPDVAEIVSGAALALLGLGSLLFGSGAAGAAALAAGIALIADGIEEVDWEKLECDLYWIDVYLFNGLTALHNLAVLGAVQHPYPSDLKVDTLTLEFNGGKIPFASGPALCKSRPVRALHTPWGGKVATWTFQPFEPREEPKTVVWRGGERWPSFVIDDVAANPATASVATPPGAWPGAIAGSFGPAVPAAVALIKDPPASLPSWNLDGDRGIGWLTWELAAPYTNPIAPVPES